MLIIRIWVFVDMKEEKRLKLTEIIEEMFVKEFVMLWWSLNFDYLCFVRIFVGFANSLIEFEVEFRWISNVFIEFEAIFRWVTNVFMEFEVVCRWFSRFCSRFLVLIGSYNEIEQNLEVYEKFWRFSSILKNYKWQLPLFDDILILWRW